MSEIPLQVGPGLWPTAAVYLVLKNLKICQNPEIFTDLKSVLIYFILSKGVTPTVRAILKQETYVVELRF